MALSEERIFDATKPVDSLSVNPYNQECWYFCSHTYLADDTDVNHDKDITCDKNTHHKECKYKYNKEKNHLKKMDSLICNSYDILKEYISPTLQGKHRVSHNLFQEIKGIMFLRIWKAGILLGGIGGTGIVMANNNGQWSNPCAVSLAGIQFGLEIGVERVDDVLLLHDETALNLLADKGHFKLGSDASIVSDRFVIDEDANIAMQGTESKSIYAYSFAKGGFIGLSLEGGVISVNESVNDEFYPRKLEAKDMLFGDIIIPQHGDLFQLKKLLKDCCANPSINEPFSNQNDVIPSCN